MFFFPSPSLLAGSATNEAAKLDARIWNESSGLKIFLPIHRCERFFREAPTRRLREVLPEVFERARQLRMERCAEARLRAVARSTTRWHLTSSEYFHSTKINCPGDSRRESKDGVVHYSHVVVGATAVRAGSHDILPIDVEEVRE